jgi:hypothetical protein
MYVIGGRERNPRGKETKTIILSISNDDDDDDDDDAATNLQTSLVYRQDMVQHIR